MRDQAAECLDRARTAAELDIKLELLAIAVAWLDLADCVEHAGSNPVSQASTATAAAKLGSAAEGRRNSL